MSPSRKIVLFLTVWVLGTSISGSPAVAQTAGATPGDQQVDHSGMDMSGMDMSGMKMPAGSTPKDMGKMQGGKAPTDARDSNAYSDGYRNSTLPNYEMADKLSIPKVQIDEWNTFGATKAVAWRGQD
jgi:copper resistance protein B